MILLACAAAGMMLASCEAGRTRGVLDDVAGFIEARPDSALAVLEGVRNDGQLSMAGRQVKAKFALLYSMALDKNYIDLTSDSIIAPAVAYYFRHGRPDDRLRAHYYRARIAENAGNEDEAMAWLVRGERCSGGAGDYNTKGRLYSSKGRIYYKQLKFAESADNMLSAMECFQKAGNDSQSCRMALKASNCFLTLGNRVMSDSLLDCASKYKALLSGETLSLYYEQQFLLADSDSARRQILQQYEDEVPSEDFDFLRLADCEIGLCCFDKAEEYLSRFAADDPSRADNARYQYYRARCASACENYKEAFEHLQTYLSLTDSIAFRAAYQNTEFIEEREQSRETINAQKYRNIILSLAVMVAVLVIALLAVMIKLLRDRARDYERRNREVSALYDSLLDERDSLKEFLASSRDNNAYDIFKKRYSVINGFVSSCAVSDGHAAEGVIDELKSLISDRSEYVRESVTLVSSFYPDFMSYLNAHGLTDKEREYCCLLALGMRGKDIGNFIEVRRHYQYGFNIRKKLGLSRDTHLHTFIQSFLSGEYGK